jgi:hypothetical protein
MSDRATLPASNRKIKLPADRGRAAEAWRAARQLRHTLLAWERWWLTLRAEGDADPGAAHRYQEAAARALEALYGLRVNAVPWVNIRSRADLDDLIAVLPPVPSGELAHDSPEPNGRGGWVMVRVPSWQEQMRLDPGFWGSDRQRLWNQLIGYTGQLLQQLKTYPLSVLAGPAGGDTGPADDPATPAGVSALNGATGTIHYRGDRAYSVGATVVNVSEREDTLLHAFIGRPAMDLPTLATRSGLPGESIPSIVANLRKKYDRLFHSAIRPPGGKSKGGYRADVVDARPQNPQQ